MTNETQFIEAGIESLNDHNGDSRENRLFRRPYHFPANGGSERDWSVRLEQAGAGCFFPLGTPDETLAAVKARQIHQLIRQQGWEAASRKFPRELILSFEWSMNPVLWTYTTIHTVTDESEQLKIPSSVRGNRRPQRVLVIEPDPGIRRALGWSINQQTLFTSVAAESAKNFSDALTIHKPYVVLLNRGLAGQLGFPIHGITTLPSGVQVLAYSVHADGDRMFDSTPAGAEGYLIKRIKPDRVLEPLHHAARIPEADGNPLSGVKAYFQAFLKPSTPGDAKNEAAPLAKLSRREREVLSLLSQGRMDKEIARVLGISVWTVHDYVKSIFERLKVHTRTEAVVRYLENCP
jgi:DNA-binding NarL/FixJ family response regulator